MTLIIVLTGERGVGKSTVCHQFVVLAQNEGWSCGGIITLAHGEVRDVLDVGSGEVRRLTWSAGTSQAVDQGRYRFDHQVLSWGGETVAQATPCDLLVIDEVGPLELAQGKGWANALDVLRGGDFRLALVVVRPELVPQAKLRLPSRATMVVGVTRDNRDQLPATLMAMLREER